MTAPSLKRRLDQLRELSRRYASKGRELGAGVRSIERWVQQFQKHGEAGLASTRERRTAGPGANVDPRWTETAIEVMMEHTDQSRPSQTMVITRANARVVARFGDGVVELPSRATAFRVIAELESRYLTFRLSTKRNRDIAERPDGVYGKLRPTRPGEYLLMDTTRLDVFGLYCHEFSIRLHVGLSCGFRFDLASTSKPQERPPRR